MRYVFGTNKMLLANGKTTKSLPSSSSIVTVDGFLCKFTGEFDERDTVKFSFGSSSLSSTSSNLTNFGPVSPG